MKVKADKMLEKEWEKVDCYRAQFTAPTPEYHRKGRVGKIIDINGRVPKLMSYNDPIPNTNKFEFIIKHDAGYQHTVQVIVDLYKA